MDIHDLHKFIEERHPNICQIAAVRSGRLVYSDCWNGYTKDDCVHIMSATKSVVALLVGIAVGKGQISGVDDKVMDYFPDYPVKRGEKTIYDVTLRHLLTMRAPYKCRSDPWTKVCSSGNWTFASLDCLGGRKGLTGSFSYQTVCLHILSGILYRATGSKTVDYANACLFAPLGIAPRSNYHAGTAEEHKRFTTERSPKGRIWFCDPEGLAAPGYGLCMSAEEMVRIGELCLNKGAYNGVRVISPGWIDEMTDPRTVETDGFRGMEYGYLWWIIDRERKIYAAVGNSGNVIYADTENDTVVAVASYFRPTVFDRVDLIRDIIEPAVLGV